MKVKRYDPSYPCDMGGKVRANMDEDEYGDYVDATDYDALLALARRLREAARNLWYNEDDTDFHAVMDDSEWLEE